MKPRFAATLSRFAGQVGAAGGVRRGQRLRDVRRAALAACIGVVLGAAIPMWNSARQMLGLQTKIGPLAAIAAILVGFVFSAIVPLFYLALYRNQGELPISRNMRWMAMIAAVAIGILTLSSIPEWIGSWRGESVVNAAARQWTIGDTAVLLGMIADFAGILLLAALYRLADDGSSGRHWRVQTAPFPDEDRRDRGRDRGNRRPDRARRHSVGLFLHSRSVFGDGLFD